MLKLIKDDKAKYVSKESPLLEILYADGWVVKLPEETENEAPIIKNSRFKKEV